MIKGHTVIDSIPLANTDAHNRILRKLCDQGYGSWQLSSLVTSKDLGPTITTAIISDGTYIITTKLEIETITVHNFDLTTTFEQVYRYTQFTSRAHPTVALYALQTERVAPGPKYAQALWKLLAKRLVLKGKGQWQCYDETVMDDENGEIARFTIRNGAIILYPSVRIVEGTPQYSMHDIGGIDCNDMSIIDYDMGTFERVKL